MLLHNFNVPMLHVANVGGPDIAVDPENDQVREILGHLNSRQERKSPNYTTRWEDVPVV